MCDFVKRHTSFYPNPQSRIKTKENTIVPTQEEFLTNWVNTALSSSDKGLNLMIKQSALDLMDRGYSESEALDVLAAKNLADIKLVQAAVQSAFSKEVVASTPEVKAQESYVVPTSYKDIVPYVEMQLKTSGSKNFMNKLARSKNPIMPINDKSFNSYVRLASLAINDESSMNILHNDLKKWFEESMYISVCAAKSSKNGIRVASSTNGKYIATNERGASCEVCIESGSCSCGKFQNGNFGAFGLACEHIIAAADMVSPHQRLIKAMAEVSSTSDMPKNEKPEFNFFDAKMVLRS